MEKFNNMWTSLGEHVRSIFDKMSLDAIISRRPVDVKLQRCPKLYRRKNSAYLF